MLMCSRRHHVSQNLSHILLILSTKYTILRMIIISIPQSVLRGFGQNKVDFCARDNFNDKLVLFQQVFVGDVEKKAQGSRHFAGFSHCSLSLCSESRTQRFFLIPDISFHVVATSSGSFSQRDFPAFSIFWVVRTVIGPSFSDMEHFAPSFGLDPSGRRG